MTRTISAADLFCGAGGTSQGFINACGMLGARPNLLAVNHWPRAISTHELNHPDVRHLCENLDGVNPRLAVPGGKLDLLCASPECTHHSRAAGGRPRNEQSRATAWHICRWAEALRVESILIENVREFMDWGPLGRNNKPLLRKKGKTFRAFLGALESLGYRVEHRLLTAADYGDPTSRERLFVLARRGNAAPDWPTASHSKLAGVLPKWRAAREIIDWEMKGSSIFRRKKKLCDNTLRRIAAGLRKFGAANAEPFLTILNGTAHGQIDSTARSLGEPLPTATGSGHFALCDPFITSYHGGERSEDRNHKIEDALPTQDTSNRFGLVQPFIVQTDQTGGSGKYVRSVDSPAYTVVGKQNVALIEPMVIGQQSCAAARPVSQPMPTVAGSGAIALVEPFIVKYYGSGIAKDLAGPLDTVTSRDRFMLVCPTSGNLIAELDILFRMLQPHELAAAQGFPSDYRFTGTREEKVKQIGNAVPVNLATALCKALIA